MNFFQTHKRAITGISACLLIGGITLSFQDTPLNYLQHYSPDIPVTDTVPTKKCCPDNEKGMTMKEFDQLSSDLDREISKAADEIKKVDWQSIEKQVKDALKEVDVEKIKAEVSNAIKEVDMEKINKEVTAALKEVDMDNLNVEIKNAVEEARKAIGNINTEEMKKEMDKAKIEIEKARVDIKKIDIDKIMLEAKEGIGKAKVELKNISLMFDQLEKDGLINKKDGFTVEYKDKTLYLNDKKQSDEVTDKYRHYFKEDHFKMIIDKEKEE